jgi:hypothetical protein
MRIGGRLHLRPATPDDIPALHRLVEHAYRGEEAKKGWTHEADLLGGQRTDEAGLAEIIAGPDRTLLLVELIAWYERRGYALTGETRPFPLDDERFGLPKRRDLEFVVMAKDL